MPPATQSAELLIESVRLTPRKLSDASHAKGMERPEGRRAHRDKVTQFKQMGISRTSQIAGAGCGFSLHWLRAYSETIRRAIFWRAILSRLHTSKDKGEGGGEAGEI